LTDIAAQERHEELKQAEVEGKPEDLARRTEPGPHSEADGKGVAPECHRNEKSFECLQGLLLDSDQCQR